MALWKRVVISFGKVGDTGPVHELFWSRSDHSAGKRNREPPAWREPKAEAQDGPSQLFCPRLLQKNLEADGSRERSEPWSEAVHLHDAQAKENSVSSDVLWLCHAMQGVFTTKTPCIFPSYHAYLFIIFPWWRGYVPH